MRAVTQVGEGAPAGCGSAQESDARKGYALSEAHASCYAGGGTSTSESTVLSELSDRAAHAGRQRPTMKGRQLNQSAPAWGALKNTAIPYCSTSGTGSPGGSARSSRGASACYA